MQPRPSATRPSATYRVQFGPAFTFEDAANIADYLRRLGISHLHCSPLLQAASATSAGYGVIDYGKVDHRLGGEEGYGKLTARLRSAGIGQVLDIAPHSMALAGRANAWWWDVLENGPASRYAGYFDIDWNQPGDKRTAAVLMPVLADRYGRVLEAGELRVGRDGAAFFVAYHDLQAPLSPRTLDDLLASAADRAGSIELKAIATDLGSLPHTVPTDPAAAAERHRDNDALKARLAALAKLHEHVAKAVDEEIEALNRDPDRLDELLGRQNYRLAYFGTAAEELPYRRFFHGDKLAGLRVERAEVFDDAHRLVLRLVGNGSLDGFRVAHVDDLADPEGYLTRLRAAAAHAYVVVDKLGPVEELPGSWPVAGPSGYGFLNLVNRLFVDPAGQDELVAGYGSFTGQSTDFGEVVRAAKLQVMREDLAAEVERLTSQLADVCERHRRQRDYTRRELRESLREVLAAFAVYRCYPRPGHEVTFADRAKVAAAVTAARQRRPDLDSELFDFIGGLLVLRYDGPEESQFAVRFAQVSAPVMAKGVQDTAFGRYQPLVCLNEVGGDPAAFGTTVADFHDAMIYSSLHWPDAMLTLSTHDALRSGDVRARISVLSELPAVWNEAVNAWAEQNAKHKRRVARHGRGGWPDRAAEHLLYQTLVGAWPIDAATTRAFMIRAVRQARQHTSQAEPQEGYEAALDEFIDAILGDPDFVASLEKFLDEHKIVARGRLNSLAQMALLLTCPGVPDIYHGAEVWDLSLANPENHRPISFASLWALLADVSDGGPTAALARDDAGGPKIWLVAKLLAHRQSFPACYDRTCGYEPLEVTGPHADRFVAFTRSGRIAVIVPRLATSMADPWTGTEVVLPPGQWVSVLTDEHFSSGKLRASALLRRFPVQVLAREA